MEIRDVVNAWRADEITLAELMRAFVLHESWDVPAPSSAVAEYEQFGTLSDIVVNELDGLRRLFLFSDAELPRDEWLTGVSSQFVNAPGQWVFQLDLREVDELVIDPGAEHSIVFDEEQMNQIAERAWATVIEDVLDELATGDLEPGVERDELSSMIADYPYFELAVYEDGDGARLVAAPNEQGRDLAAVFTHADAFDAFAEETNDEDLRSVTLSGVELCEQMREMGIEGVLFDCSGPGPALVFERSFAEDVLRAAGV